MIEKIALLKKMISKEDYLKAVESCKMSKDFDKALKDYFITNKLIPSDELSKLKNSADSIKIIKSTEKFGSIAVKMGFISSKTLEATLSIQKQAVAKNKVPKRIGQILLDSGKLNRKQIKQIINVQKRTNQSSDLFESIEFGMQLFVDDDGMSAYLRKTKDFDKTIEAYDIRAVLLEKKIQYGIVKDEIIKKFIETKEFEHKSFKIASGTPKSDGKDATILYHFKTDYLKAGKEDSEGGFDFKERGEVPKIKEKTLLAEKTPLKESNDGVDIFGNIILAEPGNDVPLKCDTGTSLSEDGMKAYSEVSGYPKLSLTGNISVMDTYTVKGDVNFETGHVTYKGNIDITGSLKNGFKVKGVDVNLFEIDGGMINSQGDVTVSGGINDAEIHAIGHVKAKFIHHSKISCLGNIYVENEIVDSQIEAGGACIIKTGNVIHSRITAKKGIHAKNIGTENTGPNELIVGQDLYVNKAITQIEDKILELRNARLSIEKDKKALATENQTHNETIKRATDGIEKILIEKQQIEIRWSNLGKHPGKNDEIILLNQKTNIIKQLENDRAERLHEIEKNKRKIQKISKKAIGLDNQLDSLSREKTDYVEWVKSNPGNAVVRVEERIISGTVIKGIHAQKKIKKSVSNVHIREHSFESSKGSNRLFEIQIT